ncbi:WG repeat-containing protein [Bacillus tianshenii]|nr:WG repeat-containing protein [Bacillus tianshenii]
MNSSQQYLSFYMPFMPDFRSMHLYPASLKVVGGKRWGYINSLGKIILPFQYEDAFDFQENGLAIVGKNELFGVIDQTGKYVVKPKYETINQFSEGRAVVVDKEGFKVINERGRLITDKAYQFIGTFEDDRALFANSDSKGNYLYGFLNRNGQEVIPNKYQSATDFNVGKAVVKVKEGQFALIDREGTVLHTYNYAYVGSYGDGLLVFQQSLNDKQGYMNEAGEVVIPAQFVTALSFQNGRAVVNISETYENKYGLIDKQGNFVIKPDYNDVNLLGEGRIAVGVANDSERPYIGSKYAIADFDGNLLTMFVYMDVSNYNNGFASANNNQNTFFIDRAGKVAENLPIVSGSGILSFDEELVKANVDYRLFYYNRAGGLVWAQNTIIPLNGQYRVFEQRYKPNKDYLVYYPQVKGMTDATTQQRVNKRLRELSVLKEVNPDVQLDYSYLGDFSVPFFKNVLLQLELNGYEYYFGAAHGMPTKDYVHVNLENGNFYELKDLFKPDSNYVKILSELVGKQIKNDEEYFYIFPDSYKGITANQSFYVTEDALYLYFSPYEIAPYAASFPTFKIPFAEIMPIINVEGEFWQAFHEEER